MTSSTLQTALEWRAAGISCVPVARDAKRVPLVKWTQYRDRTPTTDELERWFSDGTANLSLITGVQGLTIIDFDTEQAINDWAQYCKSSRVADIVRRAGYSVRTARGLHVYIQMVEAVKSRPLTVDDQPIGIDIKSRGGLCAAPPSIHKTGAPYVVENDGLILKVNALSDVLPAALLMRKEYQPQRVARVAVGNPWEAAANAGHGGFVGRGVIERIKDTVKLEDVLTDLVPTSDGFSMTRCPLHEDHNPSMWVKGNLCGCYSGCAGGRPLDIINLYARIHSITNAQAINELRRGL